MIDIKSYCLRTILLRVSSLTSNVRKERNHHGNTVNHCSALNWKTGNKPEEVYMVGTAETPTPERNQTLMVGCDHYKQEFRPKKLYDKKYCKHSSFLDVVYVALIYISNMFLFSDLRFY